MYRTVPAQTGSFLRRFRVLRTTTVKLIAASILPELSVWSDLCHVQLESIISLRTIHYVYILFERQQRTTAAASSSLGEYAWPKQNNQSSYESWHDNEYSIVWEMTKAGS